MRLRDHEQAQALSMGGPLDTACMRFCKDSTIKGCKPSPTVIYLQAQIISFALLSLKRAGVPCARVASRWIVKLLPHMASAFHHQKHPVLISQTDHGV